MKQRTAFSLIAALVLTAAVAVASHEVSMADRQFVSGAIAYNNQEIAWARAESESKDVDSAVRSYADKTLEAYVHANGRIEALAKQYDLAYPTPMPVPEAVSAQTYMQQEATRHQHAITLYESHMKNGTNTPLRQYAAEMLPTLKSQLAMAQQYLATNK